MASIARGAKAAGGTDFTPGTAALADEVDTDLDTIVNKINGSINDDNINDISKATQTDVWDPDEINDASNDEDAHKVVQSPGTDPDASQVLPTDLEDELQQLRYKAKENGVGTGTKRFDTVAGAEKDVGWYTLPARGPNWIANPEFLIDTSTTANDPPDGWTKVGTPTTLETQAKATADGAGNELHCVAASANEGVRRTVTGLRSSTLYAIIYRAYETSGDTLNVTTTGATGTTYSNIAGVHTDTSYTEYSHVILTDATPTDIVLSFLADAGGDEFFIDYAYMMELRATPIPGEHGSAYSGQAIVTSETTVPQGPSWTSLSGFDTSITCPGANFEIEVKVELNYAATSGAGEGWFRLMEDAVQKRTGLGQARTTYSGSMVTMTYVNDAPVAGTTYDYTVEGQSSNAVGVIAPNGNGPSSLPTFQHDSALTWTVRRRLER